MKNIFFLIMIVLGFFSCKKDTSQTAATNQPPVAHAGNDTAINLPANTINLDGSRSIDPDNNITGYVWTKISGPSSASITNANAAQTQVSNLIEGIYQFELKVTDAGGLFSRDVIQVTVNQQTNTSLVDIYVAGYEWNDSRVRVAKYWKNGQAIALTDGTKDAGAYSIVVVGGDVYVAGGENNGNGVIVAKYWKNGQAIPLTDGTKNAGANSIAVVGSDVYVAGNVSTSGSVWDPPTNMVTYWKNGHAIGITDGTTVELADVDGIAVVGSDVFVRGSERIGPGTIVKYWKNGQAVPLTDGTKVAWGGSIAVTGSDVYVAGGERSLFGIAVAKYWKNGQAIALSDGTSEAVADGIAVVGSDIYVTGKEVNPNSGNGVAKYWKNGQAIALSDGTTEAWAGLIEVVDGDVYMAGSEASGFVNGVATVQVIKYWKNGQAITLPGGVKPGVTIYSMAVAKR